MREDFDINSRKPKKAGIILAIVFIIIIALIGLYVVGASSKKSEPIIIPTSTPIPTLIPVATENLSPTEGISPTKTTPLRPSGSEGQAKTSRSDLEITVLNGSGITGAAKTISSYLAGLGYTIKSTGNADNYEYQGITIIVSKDKSSYLAQLKKDLSEKSATVSGSIDDSLTIDAEVIVGK